MDPLFRMVCSPAALADPAKEWAAETLREGEVALLVDGGGLEAVNAAAHALDLLTVSIVRSEESPDRQDETVIAFAGSFPLVWIAGEFTDSAKTWAHDRRPMTLLVEADGPLPADERHRIARFLALLARQTE
jgi:hypothetical protein